MFPSLHRFQRVHRKVEIMKVFIVEDAQIVREALKTLLSEIPGIAIIGFAADEADAIRKIGEMRPDVVILDISLNPGSGIEVLRAVKQNLPAIRIMILTNYADDIYARCCMNAGADYFFDKSLEFMRVGAVLKQLVFTGGLDNRFVALQ